jgi:hypothetical protein
MKLAFLQQEHSDGETNTSTRSEIHHHPDTASQDL